MKPYAPRPRKRTFRHRKPQEDLAKSFYAVRIASEVALLLERGYLLAAGYLPTTVRLRKVTWDLETRPLVPPDHLLSTQAVFDGLSDRLRAWVLAQWRFPVRSDWNIPHRHQGRRYEPENKLLLHSWGLDGEERRKLVDRGILVKAHEHGIPGYRGEPGTGTGPDSKHAAWGWDLRWQAFLLWLLPPDGWTPIVSLEPRSWESHAEHVCMVSRAIREWAKTMRGQEWRNPQEGEDPAESSYYTWDKAFFYGNRAGVTVAYRQGKRSKRFYSQIQQIPRKFRDELFPDTREVDIENCHPNLLRQVAEREGWDCPVLADYCDHREGWLQRLQQIAGCDRKAAKNYIIALLYCTGHLKRIPLPVKQAVVPKGQGTPVFLKSLARELRVLADQLWSQRWMWRHKMRARDQVREKIRNIEKWALDHCSGWWVPPSNELRRKWAASSAVAFFLTALETRVGKHVEVGLRRQGLQVSIRIHDGVRAGDLTRKSWWVLSDAKLRRVEARIFRKTGYRMHLVVKELVKEEAGERAA